MKKLKLTILIITLALVATTSVAAGFTATDDLAKWRKSNSLIIIQETDTYIIYAESKNKDAQTYFVLKK